MQVYNHNSLQLHYFPEFTEFLDATTVEVAKKFEGRDKWCQSGPRADKVDDWYGKGTHKQAWDRAATGVEVELDALEIRDEISSHIGPVVRETFAWDVSGEMVDVGAYLSGEPECMITTREETTRAKRRIAFIYNASAAAIVSPKIMELRGLAVMSVIDALEKTGRFSIAAYATLGTKPNFRRDTDGGLAVIRLMDSDYRYDPQALGFALCDPAMFRRLGFCYLDSLSNSDANTWMGLNKYGYAYPQQATSLPDEIDSGDAIVTGSLAFDGHAFGQIRSLQSAIDWAVACVKSFSDQQ